MLAYSFLLYQEPHYIVLQQKLVVWKNKFQREYLKKTAIQAPFMKFFSFWLCAITKMQFFFLLCRRKSYNATFFYYLEEETTMQAWFVRKEEKEMQCNTSFFFPFWMCLLEHKLVALKKHKREKCFFFFLLQCKADFYVLFLMCVLCTM